MCLVCRVWKLPLYIFLTLWSLVFRCFGSFFVGEEEAEEADANFVFVHVARKRGASGDLDESEHKVEAIVVSTFWLFLFRFLTAFRALAIVDTLDALALALPNWGLFIVFAVSFSHSRLFCVLIFYFYCVVICCLTFMKLRSNGKVQSNSIVDRK